MHATSIALASAHAFDFKARFYFGGDFVDLWNSGCTWGSAAGMDFNDWAKPSMLTDQNLAVQYQFTELTSKITDLSIGHQGTTSLAKWSVTLSGHGYDSVLMARNKTVACTLQMRNGTTWTSEGLGFIGCIVGFQPQASFNINGAFKLIVEGVGHFMEMKQLPPQSWGKINLAEGKNCVWSSTLSEPSQLVGIGEFVGTQVTLGPENAVDGVVYGPPAVSANPPSHDTYQTFNEAPRIREVYLWPPTGFGPEYQWFAVSADVTRILTNGKGYFQSQVGRDKYGNPESCYYHTFTPWPAGPGGPTDEIGIFCYNRTCVEELFDISGAAWVVEWGKSMPGYFLNPNQDYIIAVGSQQPGKAGTGPTIHEPIDDFVIWSTNSAWWPTEPVDYHGCSDSYIPTRDCWIGNPFNPSTLSAGKSLARKYWDGAKWVLGKDTDNVTDWSVNALPLPLGVPRNLSYECATLDIGAVDCKLDLSFTPGGYPKTMTLDTTFGLSDSGSVQVSTSVFTYDSRTNTTLNITGGPSSGSAIGAGNQVYQYDTVANVIRRGHRISHIRFWRKPGLTHLAFAELHASYLTGNLRLPQPTDPIPPDGTVDPWWLDWGAIGDPKWGITIAPPRSVVTSGLVEVGIPCLADNPEKNRYTQLFLRCWHMQGNGRAATDPLYTADGGYFMLNEIEVFSEQMTNPFETFTGSTAGEVIKRLIARELGYPRDKIVVSSEVPSQFKSQTTVKTKCSNILSELAQSYGLVIYEALDGTIHIEVDPWWPTTRTPTSIAATFAFDRNMLAFIEERADGLHAIAQAKITARDPEGKFTFTGLYPKREGTFGDIVGGEGVYIASNQTWADKIAEAIYKRNDNNIFLDVTAIGPLHWLRPYMIVTVDWPYEDGAARHPTWIVTNVNHGINFGNALEGQVSAKDWTTGFTLQAFTYSGGRPIDVELFE